MIDMCSNANHLQTKLPLMHSCTLHIDNFAGHSKSKKSEQWFDDTAKSRVKVDFMGNVNWFLGQRYNQVIGDEGETACHVSQQAFVEGI